MKKMKRIVALVLTLLICLILCSCKELDEKRQRHALRQADGTVCWNGAVYKPLSEYGYEVIQELNIFESAGGYVYVTDADVPVLLSNYFGVGMSLYKNDSFMMSWRNERFYCRTDAYEQVVADLDAIVARKVAVGYSFTFRSPYNGQEIVVPLTQEQQNALETVKSTVTSEYWVKPELKFDAVTLVEHNCFGEPLNDVAMLECTPDGGYVLIMHVEEPIRQFEVPEEYNALFDEMMAPFWEAHGMAKEIISGLEQF
ncbi:MAG: hypothetical protein IKU51_07750 [Clostridia bacterium]|nr:hypothetical protein [Clostridia bacterium]